MNKESIDLSKTGYFDYLIKNGRIEDPGLVNEISDTKEIFVSNDGGLDYGPVPNFKKNLEI